MIANFLFLHAVSKARSGQFEDALPLFDALMREFNDENGRIGLVYCYVRLHQYENAKQVLKLEGLSERATAIAKRLEKRIEKELAHG